MHRPGAGSDAAEAGASGLGWGCLYLESARAVEADPILVRLSHNRGLIGNLNHRFHEGAPDSTPLPLVRNSHGM
jgi:hypothetical protein